MTDRRDIDFVLHTIEKRDVRFVRLWFTDVLGNLKSFAVSPEDLEEAFDEGIGFDGSAVDGTVPPEESDMLIFPDPATFQLLPWRPKEAGVARMICNVRTPDGQSFAGDPRACLRHMFHRAEAKGYLFNVGPELEYFYFGDSVDPVPQDNAGYFDLTPYDSSRDLRRNTTLMLEKMSIPVAYSYHDAAPSQNGIQLRYAEAVTCADNIVTARQVIKQCAYNAGLYASFMPKPLTDEFGSALFLHQSLFDREGNNLFYSNDDKNGPHLSSLARHYIAGILRYAREFSLVTNPTVNSYKRLLAASQVPISATWGLRNRYAMVRVPTYKPGKESATRIELRSPDPTCNPYLALTATLAAGIRGIEEQLQLPEEAAPTHRMSAAELSERGIDPLPHDLGEAIRCFEGSELMRETLGEHIFGYLLQTKREEWEDYCSTVTDWERKKYYAGF